MPICSCVFVMASSTRALVHSSGALSHALEHAYPPSLSLRCRYFSYKWAEGGGVRMLGHLQTTVFLLPHTHGLQISRPSCHNMVCRTQHNTSDAALLTRVPCVHIAVLSADAFSAFEEVGLEDDEAVQKTGRRFRDTVLALGGSQAPAEVFKV